MHDAWVLRRIGQDDDGGLLVGLVVLLKAPFPISHHREWVCIYEQLRSLLPL